MTVIPELREESFCQMTSIVFSRPPVISAPIHSKSETFMTACKRSGLVVREVELLLGVTDS